SGVITGAAAVLISVALPFTFTDLVFTQVLGFALLFGILLDATIVRLILVPSVLLMLGERAWSRPAPRVAVREQTHAG
ncbi:MAG: putative drug exporter of the superfamily, partial [Solirubrobacteraceae bacterium]|nr:putative drug exporter of the superfamily [Solirubrobacteraceae bacterium]